MSTYIYNPSLLDNLAGKTVIVTGGAHGIGAQTVRSFHAHGMNVVVADLPSSDATAKALIASLSNSAIFIPVDLSIWADTRNLFKKTIEHFGQVDIVAANAGVMEHKAFFDFELDEDGELREPVESYRVIDVNLKGTMNTLRLAFFYMRNNTPSLNGSRGSVVLTSSTAGYFGGTGVVSYVASKHGVIGLLRSSQAVASTLNIRLNAVAPSLTPTHMTSEYSEGWINAGLPTNTTQDVATAIIQLSSDATMEGKCILVAGKTMLEVEAPRTKIMPSWMGEFIVELMAKSGSYFRKLGGYPLPPPQRQ